MSNDQSWRAFKERVVQLSNEAMRARYMSTDAGVGSEILQARKKGLSSENMFQLRQKWSPIAWPHSDGLDFEISPLSARTLGQSMLDPEIDQMLVDATRQAITENVGDILTTLLADTIHDNDLQGDH